MKEKDIKLKDALYIFIELFGSIAIGIQVTDNYPWNNSKNVGPFETPIMVFFLFLLPLILCGLFSEKDKIEEKTNMDCCFLKYQILIISLFAIGNLFF